MTRVLETLAIAGLLGLASASSGCGNKAATSTSTGSALPPPSTSGPATSGVVAAHEPLAIRDDRTFARARSTHDPIDLEALGRKAGATALLEALADPPSRETALGAIPYAEDVDLAFQPLAAIAMAKPGTDDAYAALDAIAVATERPRLLGELLDPDGVHAAANDLLAIAKDLARPDKERALATTILGRLADRGFVRRADIPAL